MDAFAGSQPFGDLSSGFNAESRSITIPDPSTGSQLNSDAARPPKKKTTTRRRAGSGSGKRRCISTACIACRKRKSKCDGALPSCAACASVYGTECIYDPNSDHRRKGVYREKVDSMKARSSTLQILIEAILNAAEDDVPGIVAKIRTCDSLDAVAEHIINQQQEAEREAEAAAAGIRREEQPDRGDLTDEGERELARKMGELRVENGNVRFIGGTSHLIYLGEPADTLSQELDTADYSATDDPITTWTRVTKDARVIKHLMQMYLNYHYPYFTTLSKTMFLRDYTKGKAGLAGHTGTIYCSSLLVNAMLALGCHFTDIPEACAVPGDNRTKGDHFFAEAKRLILENDEFARPRLVTVQALALMSVHEAGCAREAKGWVYSGMSFRMAQDIGLNLEVGGMDKERMTEHEIDARKITFWGCFLFDKCWSNYLGRLPQLPGNSYSVSKLDVFPQEDSEPWQHYTDNGYENKEQQPPQPARTRAAALQLSALCEISSDLLIFFYHPNHIGRSSGKAVELKKLSELHRRLEEWRKNLPAEFEPRDGQLPNVILMHMFFHLQYIHLFRPFLKYHPSSSPLPSHVSPRRICTANAGAISKLARLYKKSWDLRQICNIAVYMLHSACTIHLLNLNIEKTARRDITHGVRHLEEIAEDWPCARRTLAILSVLARKWKCELPAEAAVVLTRADEKFGEYTLSEVPSPHSQSLPSPTASDKANTTRNGHRESSPLMQYAQSQLTRPQEPSSIGDRLSNADSIQNFSTFPNASPSAALGTMSPDWRSQPPQQQMQDFPVSYAQHQILPQASQQQGQQRQPVTEPQQQRQQPEPQLPQQPTPLGFPMDGQDWFLNDSARWHQSFEAWPGPGPNSPPVFMFNGNDRVASASPASSGAGAQALSGQGTGAGTSAGPAAAAAAAAAGADPSIGGYGFEGLGMSLQEGGWLPGLD